MPISTARTRRLNAVFEKYPKLTSQALAARLGNSPKTVNMWRAGQHQSIPEIALRFVEHLYPVESESPPVEDEPSPPEVHEAFYERLSDADFDLLG